MGIGGALIMPSTLSILTNVFPAEERGRAIGIWAGVVRPRHRASGPIVGGWLLEHFWWGSVFLVNVPVVIVALIAGPAASCPTSKDPHAQRPRPGRRAALDRRARDPRLRDHRGAVARAGPSPQTLATFAFTAVVLVAFAVWELRSDHPMLDVTFFENPRFTAANVSITLVFFALFGSLFFLTQYLQFVLGYTRAGGGHPGRAAGAAC